MTDDPYEAGDQLTAAPVQSSRVWVALLCFGIAVVLLLSFSIPPMRSAREAARRTQCKGHLKQIALALHNYHDVYGSFPPAYTTNADGKRLHSWRTLVLPFLDGQDFYESIDLSKPWDHPDNVHAHNQTPPTYRCPSTNLEPHETTYVGIVGDEFAFILLLAAASVTSPMEQATRSWLSKSVQTRLFIGCVPIARSVSSF